LTDGLIDSIECTVLLKRGHRKSPTLIVRINARNGYPFQYPDVPGNLSGTLVVRACERSVSSEQTAPCSNLFL